MSPMLVLDADDEEHLRMKRKHLGCTLTTNERGYGQCFTFYTRIHIFSIWRDLGVVV